MDIDKILKADLLDIIFEGRNKDYGAYELRKTYNKRVVAAVLAMAAVSILLFVTTIFANLNTGKQTAYIPITEVTLQNAQEEKQVQPPVTPPAPKQRQLEIRQFTAPKIVNEEVKDPPPPQEELDDTKIGTINQDGLKTDVVAPPEEKGTGIVEAPKATEDYEKEFKTVQVEAKFPGGLQAWKKYLETHLRQDVPVENGAPAGRYTVTVSFLVDKEGNISEVRAENEPGYGIAAEAIRVIQRGPKWQPALQNGRNVIYRQRQSITFEVNEE